MDEILQKFLNGEIEEEEFNKVLDGMSDEDKKSIQEKLSSPELKGKLVEKSREELSKISALRKERQRIEARNAQPPKEEHNANDTVERLREENVETAFSQFFDEFSIADDNRGKYRDEFKKLDSGAVNVQNILRELRKIYVHEHADEFIEARKKYEELHSGAEEFNKGNSGAPGGAGSGGTETEKFSPTVKEYVSEARKKGLNLTNEEAKKVLEDGFTRVIG